MNEKITSELMKTAENARKNAYAPYSGFMVGAALISKSGKIYTGCNIENAAYSPTVCAERTAIFKAVSEGEREFSAIAIAGGMKDGRNTEGFIYPCGVCLQTMLEFCDRNGFEIIVKNAKNETECFYLYELLPHGFSI